MVSVKQLGHHTMEHLALIRALLGESQPAVTELSNQIFQFLRWGHIKFL